MKAKGATPSHTSKDIKATSKPYHDTTWIPLYVVTSIVLTIYWYCAFPGIAGGDSGELVAEACINGVAHPPGYPLYLVLLRMALNLPYMSEYPAWTSNILCCIYGATAAGFIAQTIHVWTTNASYQYTVLSSISAGIIFALSPLIWEYSIGSEVFALNNMLISMILFLTTQYACYRSYWSVCCGALLCGLGLTNQHTIVLFEVPLILWILYSGKDSFRIKDICIFATLFCVGLLPYADTHLRGKTPTRGSWGDTSTLTGFLRHLLRKEYGTFALSPLNSNVEGFMERTSLYLHDALQQYIFIGFFIALFGLYCSFNMSSKITKSFPTRGKFPAKNINIQWLSYAFLTAEVLYLVIFHSLANLPLSSPLPRAIHSRFWMQPNIIIALWLGIGFVHLENSFQQQKIADVSSKQDLKNRRLPRYFIVLCQWMLILLQLILWFPWMNHRSNGEILSKYGRAILESLPENAILLSHTDINWNSVRYLQECEHLRLDVIHFNFEIIPYPWFERQKHLYPNVAFPQVTSEVSTQRQSRGNTNLITRFLEANIDTFPNIFLDLHSLNEQDIANGGRYFQFQLLPIGLLWKIERFSQKMMQIAQWDETSQLIFKTYETALDVAKAYDYPDSSWEFASAKIYWDAMYQRCLHFLGYLIEESSKVTPATLEKFVQGLVSVTEGLDKVLQVIDEKNCLSYPLRDALKNNIVAYMRLNAIASVLHAAEDNKSYAKKTRLRTKRLIKRFIALAPDDEHIEIFRSHLQSLKK